MTGQRQSVRLYRLCASVLDDLEQRGPGKQGDLIERTGLRPTALDPVLAQLSQDGVAAFYPVTREWRALPTLPCTRKEGNER